MGYFGGQGGKVWGLCGRIFVCVGRLWRGVFVPIWGIGQGKFSGSAVGWGGFSFWWSFGGGERNGGAIGGVDGGRTLSEADEIGGFTAGGDWEATICFCFGCVEVGRKGSLGAGGYVTLSLPGLVASRRSFEEQG